MSLIRMVQEGNLDDIKKNFRLLAGFRTKVNEVDDEGKSALMFAALNPSENAMPILEFLLKQGANPDLQDAKSNTALILLCDDEDSELNQGQIRQRIELLVLAGANLNLQNKEGQTAPMLFNFHLDWSDTEDVLAITKLFLKHGYNPNIQEKYGSTWLHNSCMNTGLVEAVEMLIPYTDLTIQDHYGRTVLMEYLYDLADRENGDKNSVFFKLLAHGTDVNAADATGKTILMYAVESTRESEDEQPDYTDHYNDVAHCVERVKMLLRLGANPHVRWQGKTAKDLAPLDVVKNLLSVAPENNEDPVSIQGGRRSKCRTVRRRFQKRL